MASPRFVRPRGSKAPGAALTLTLLASAAAGVFGYLHHASAVCEARETALDAQLRALPEFSNLPAGGQRGEEYLLDSCTSDGGNGELGYSVSSHAPTATVFASYEDALKRAGWRLKNRPHVPEPPSGWVSAVSAPTGLCFERVISGRVVQASIDSDATPEFSVTFDYDLATDYSC